jgi:hypothetical protein
MSGGSRPWAPKRFARRRLPPFFRIVVGAVAWRLISALVAFAANLTLPLARPEQFTVFERTNRFWDTFARYDSGWFYGIAHHGYQFTPGGRDNMAFFPVYPLLMRYVGDLFGGGQPHYYIAAVAVSWIAFVGAMVLLYRVARLDLPDDAAERAVVYAAVFPFAFFFGVAYSESVFLLFVLASVYLMRTGRWWLGGVAGAMACLTRVNGIFAVPTLLVVALQAPMAGPRFSRQRIKALAAVAVAASGLLAYSLFVYSKTGSLFHWADTITRWDYHPGGSPITPIVTLLVSLVTHPYAYLTQQPMAPYDLLNGSAAILALVAIPFVWRRFGFGYALVIAFNLWVPLSSGSLVGLGRYCAVLFPIFLWLATFERVIVRRWLLGVFGVLYVGCLALFTTLHPLF